MEKRYFASFCIGDYETCKGEGSTQEEADENCLIQLREDLSRKVEVKLAENVWVSEEEASVVAILPEGHGLFMLTRYAHSSGDRYDTRYFALRKGPCVVARAPHGHGEEPLRFEMGDVPAGHSFMDCNDNYKFWLPKGSLQLVDGVWVPRKAAEYDY